MKIIAVIISALFSSGTFTQVLQNESGWRPAWGIDRIDQRESNLNDRYNYSYNGAGVVVYVFDSGIYSGHEEFEGRVDPGYTVISDGYGTEDCAGHGTHTASLIGGKKYGVAKAVRFVPVRVLNCRNANYSIDSLYPAIDWMVEHHKNGTPAVVNMSVGMPKSSAFNEAIMKLINDGMIVVGAAGNQNNNACLYSPPSETSIISVGATDKIDSRAPYSNYGSCIDLFAPGSDLVAAWAGSVNTYRSTSGTSNAAPIVSGIVATMLQRNPSLTQLNVERILTENATRNAISNIGVGTTNLLAYSNIEMSISFEQPVETSVPTQNTAPAETKAVEPTLPETAITVPQPLDGVTCTTPAERTYFYGVPYVCVNTGNALLWIPKKYSPGRP